MTKLDILKVIREIYQHMEDYHAGEILPYAIRDSFRELEEKWSKE